MAMPIAVPMIPGLGHRRVEDPFPAEPGGQAIGHPEHPAQGPDVLAEHQHARIGGQGSGERGVQRGHHRDRGRAGAV